MKKIGIMSMQRVINYGSFLQAYGLKKTISILGYNVEFIDYKFEREVIEKEKKSNMLIKKIKNNLNPFTFFRKKIQMIRFSDVINKSLEKIGVRKEKNYSKNIETLLIGSDEVFNCLQPYPVGFSRNLFGFEYEGKKVISYAASFGYTTIDGLEKYKIKNEVSELLKKFSSISVRDVNSYKIINQLTNTSPSINMDPVLITDFSKEIAKNPMKKSINDYIIIYAYTGRLEKEEEKFIIKFAKQINKKIVSVGFYQRIAKYNISPNPFEMLNYIKNADYVITDTFHGTIFSAKMNTKFCTIIRDSNKNKLEHLLDAIGLSNRKANDLEDIKELYNQEIDFSITNNIIEKEKEKSINYLKSKI